MSSDKIYNDRSGIVKLLKKLNQTSFGYEVPPLVVADTDPHEAPENMYITAVKAINGDIVIDSAKDQNGVAISALANVTIQQGDILYFPLTEITLTSGKAILYYTTKMSF